jgi:hypothetical protein
LVAHFGGQTLEVEGLEALLQRQSGLVQQPLDPSLAP